MVLQRPPKLSPEVDWAWDAFDPQPASPGALVRELDAAGASVEVALLSVRNGSRRTAADVWLQPSEGLHVMARATVSAADIAAWSAAGRSVLVAAGVFGSPGLVHAVANPAKDHPSAVVGFALPTHLQNTTTDEPTATAIIRRGGVQLLVLERAGSDPHRGALIVSAMVEPVRQDALAAGVDDAVQLLAEVGIQGHVQPGPAPVAHACCTLTGVATAVPVVDASTLPALPSVNPMVAVAAHARSQTLMALA